LLTVAGWINSLKNAYEKDGDKGYQARLKQVKNLAENFYLEYNPTVDRNLFEAMMAMYVKDQEDIYQSPLLKKIMAENTNQLNKVSSAYYNESLLTNDQQLKALLNKPAADVVAFAKKDPSVLLYADLTSTYSDRVTKNLNEIQSRINKLNRVYMQAQMDVFKEKMFYPDANSTLRVTYGNVKGYNPRDAVKYDYYTYLDGVMDKYKPGDYEFDVPQKLQELYKSKNYGQYGSNGKMPVCFIGMNHTTGGNSGSPALDAYGNLIGLNFDRVWEGTMSDINYDPSLCRNIMVDIRYVLFIIDKYAGATNLISEMKLVHPKKK
jgi:hypothetical protein